MGLFDDTAARLRRTVTPGAVAADSVTLRHVPPGLASSAPVRSLRPVPTGNPLRTPSPLLGGLTLEMAARIHAESRSIEHAKKNLFIVEVSDLKKTKSGLVEGDGPYTFNFFAVDVGYTAHNLIGEKRRIGGAVVDGLLGQEPIEMRITTFDDTLGTLKSWFREKAAAISNRDGTVGVPADYLVKIRVRHATIYGAESDPFGDEYLMRPMNLEHDLSRRDDALAELQMTFTEADTQARP